MHACALWCMACLLLVLLCITLPLLEQAHNAEHTLTMLSACVFMSS